MNPEIGYDTEVKKIMQKGGKRTSLNIKDAETRRLAQEIAEATGETLTRAVTQALHERYERIQRRRGKATVRELAAIAGRVAALVKRPYLDHAELLYDERGLPK